MRNFIQLTLCVALVFVVAGAKGQKGNKPTKPKREAAETTVSEMKLPDKVRKTFVDKFPNAVINKLDEEKEGGVMVYDIEFRDGRSRKETDIAEDGTMLEYTVYVTNKTVPKPAMRKMEQAAKEHNAKMGTLERIEVSYETKDGKVVKLDKTQTRYALELKKDGQTSEIEVDVKGKVIEAPKFEAPKEKK
jgi:uncharacterized membrane protein YkoI